MKTGIELLGRMVKLGVYGILIFVMGAYHHGWGIFTVLFFILCELMDIKDKIEEGLKK